MAHAARLLTAFAVLILFSCEDMPQGEVEPGEAHIDIPEENIHDVMQAKLVHTQALLEGIALQNYRQIELNAMALTSLSEESDWHVHETLAYAALSDEFRAVTRSLTQHAEDENGEAVRDDYVLMIESCMKCHVYLRKEGLFKDLPGAVSMGMEEGAIGY